MRLPISQKPFTAGEPRTRWKTHFTRRDRRPNALVRLGRVCKSLLAAARSGQFVFFLLPPALIVGVAQHHSPRVVRGPFFGADASPRSPYDPADDAMKTIE